MKFFVAGGSEHFDFVVPCFGKLFVDIMDKVFVNWLLLIGRTLGSAVVFLFFLVLVIFDVIFFGVFLNKVD